MGALARGIGAATHETFTHSDEGNPTPNFGYHVPTRWTCRRCESARSIAVAVHALGTGMARRRRCDPRRPPRQDALKPVGRPIVRDSCNPPFRVFDLIRDPAASREGLAVADA